MPFFIVIEGIDSVGKTDTAKEIARQTGAKYIKTPIAPFNELREPIDHKVSTKTQCLFHIAANQHASEYIEQLLTNGESLVCDRYIYSTQVYHEVIDPNTKELYPKTKILEPDLTVILTAPRATRESRLTMRFNDPSYGDKPHEKDQDYQDKVQAKYQTLGKLEINTEENSLNEVVALIIKEINQLENTRLTYKPKFTKYKI